MYKVRLHRNPVELRNIHTIIVYSLVLITVNCSCRQRYGAFSSWGGGGKCPLSPAIFLFIKDKFVPVPKHHNLKIYRGIQIKFHDSYRLF
jgi:hypothetical protein